MKLQDKVAVITGGNSGIGLATAREFKANGAKLVLFGRDRKTRLRCTLRPRKSRKPCSRRSSESDAFDP